MPRLSPQMRRTLLRIQPFYPAAITFVFLLIGLAPRRILPFADITPQLALISIYYWTLFRPRLMPIWAAFLFGLMQDSMLGLPLGVTSLIYMCFWWLTSSQRRVITKETFLTTWFGFGVLSALMLIMAWLILSFLYSQKLPGSHALLQWGLTVGLYPPLHSLCNRIYAVMPKPITLR